MKWALIASWLKFAWSAAGIVLGITVYRLNRRNSRKALSFEYSHGDVAVVSGAFKRDLEIFYKGAKIEDVSAVTIAIKNSGGAAIQKSDFEGGLRLSLPGSSGILLVRVSSSPPELTDSLKFTTAGDSEPAARVFEPMLLNAGDTVTMFVLVTGFKNRVELSARIAGVKTIERPKGGFIINLTWPMGLSALFSMCFVCGMGWEVANESMQWRNPTSQQLFEMVIAAICVLLTYSLWRGNVYRKIL